ncbi:MAG: hypothetical protein ACXWIU_09230 [Limisphaerales bacterium]
MLDRLQIDPTNVVQLDCDGRIISLSDLDLQWYVGREQGSAIAAQLREHDRQIRELETTVIRTALLEFEVDFSGGLGLPEGAQQAVELLRTNVRDKDFERASRNFTSIVKSWSLETRKHVGEKKIFELDFGLQQLAALKQQQFESLGVNLRPPRMHQIFWSSPSGALIETLLWSFFGVLTNLILNMSQARQKGILKIDESWVIWSKVIYGPILSFVLILTIYFGMINPGSEARFWVLPLLGFLFGYNSRKTALVIDKLSDKIFGNISKSIDKDLQYRNKAARVAAENVFLKMKPRSLDEMQEQAPKIVDAAIVAALHKNQTKT